MLWERAEEAICSVRRAVFTGGEGQPKELILDGYDPASLHALAWSEGGKPIGTARLHLHLKEHEGTIGYMAVLPALQGCGVGRAMLHFLIGMAMGRELTRISVAARAARIRFFEQEGFRVTSGLFDDSGIPHHMMTLLLKPLGRHSGGAPTRPVP